MRRRTYLAIIAGAIPAASGCIGENSPDTGSPTDSSDGTSPTSNQTSNQQCLEEVQIEKTGFGSIERDGMKITIDSVITGPDYEVYDKKSAAEGATFVGLPITYEVTGAGERSFHSVSMLRYGLAELRHERINTREVTFQGDTYIDIDGQKMIKHDMGSKVDGILIYQLPVEFDPEHIVLEVYPTTKFSKENSPVYWRLGAEPGPYQCPPLVPQPTEATVNDSISCAGVTIEIEQVIVTNEANEGVVRHTERALIVHFNVENTTDIPRKIPDVAAEYGNGRTLAQVPSPSGEGYVVGGEELPGLHRKEGRRIFPEVPVSGVLIWELPTGVSKEDVTLTVEFEDAESNASWSLA
ncbi:MAG: hypothetical protein U5J64_07185 [Halobacteriales archaeon]|nr:hypothetical protein [Halobacteriales archaeon]